MVWSTELCASVPRTVLGLLFEKAKTSRLALSQIPFELHSFLPCNALFIPNREKERHLSLGPRPIFFFLFSSLTPPRGTERYCSLGPRQIIQGFFKRHPVAQSDTALSVLDRSFVERHPVAQNDTSLLVRDRSLFLTPPGAHNLLTQIRGTEPTLLSRFAIACVQLRRSYLHLDLFAVFSF